jgi:hypothetical protein
VRLVIEQDISSEMLSTLAAPSPSSQFPNTETLGEFLMRDVSHAKGTCAVIILTQSLVNI